MYKQKLISLFIIITILSFGFNVKIFAQKFGGGCDIQYGFLTASINITDVSSGSTGGAFSTSGFPEPPGSMSYTQGGSLDIEVTGGGDQQQDNPVNWTLVVNGTSDEGSFFSGSSDGSRVPSFSITLHNVNTTSITVNTEQCGDSASATVNLNGVATPSFSLTCSPATQTITAGSATSFNLSTSPSNGFSSAVNFTNTFSPNAGTLPSVSFVNNDAVPSDTTTAVITTTSSTTPGTYTITFTGTGGGVSQNCATQIVVVAAPPGFSFTITPNPTSVNKGANAIFTVTAVCTGGFTGTISSLSASSTFTGLSYAFSPAVVACGGNTTLTIGNTGPVPAGELSPVGGTAIYKTITVTGQEVSAAQGSD